MAMTKREMITEVVGKMNWCPTTMERNIDRAVRLNSTEGVARIYNAYLEDKEHYRFYAVLLCR